MFVNLLIPLDTACLWENWHKGTNLTCGCSCEPEFSPGYNESAFTNLSYSVTKNGELATALIYLGTDLIWSNSVEHARYAAYTGRSDYLSTDECESCGCVSCSDLDGPSLGSIRFRLALGSPSENLVSGFLYFNRDSLFTPTASSFELMTRKDARVVDTYENLVRNI